MLEINAVYLVKGNNGIVCHYRRIRKIIHITVIYGLAAFEAIYKIVTRVKPQFYLFALQQNQLILRKGGHRTAHKNQGKKEISLHSIRITR
jgi:hypothetical protein